MAQEQVESPAGNPKSADPVSFAGCEVAQAMRRGKQRSSRKRHEERMPARAGALLRGKSFLVFVGKN
jgi:hypothetical protein